MSIDWQPISTLESAQKKHKTNRFLVRNCVGAIYVIYIFREEHLPVGECIATQTPDCEYQKVKSDDFASFRCWAHLEDWTCS